MKGVLRTIALDTQDIETAKRLARKGLGKE